MADFVQREFLEPKVLARLGALPLFARMAMQGTVSGRHRSPHRGSSVEFAEYRKYVPGDDTRRLDWRAYARTDRFYIKEFEAETNLRLCLVIDGSGSMNFGSGALSKIAYARRIAGVLGYLALSQGDAVGLTVVGEEEDLDIPPRRRPSHLAHVNDAIAEVEPDGEADVARALHELAERIRQRALVVVLSDLFVPPEALESAFQHLQFQKHDVVAFQLLDPQEIEFDFGRTTRFVDLEGGAPVVADPAAIARKYNESFERHRNALDDSCRKANVDFHRVVIDQPYDKVLADFLIGRAQKGPRS